MDFEKATRKNSGLHSRKNFQKPMVTSWPSRKRIQMLRAINLQTLKQIQMLMDSGWQNQTSLVIHLRCRTRYRKHYRKHLG